MGETSTWTSRRSKNPRSSWQILRHTRLPILVVAVAVAEALLLQRQRRRRRRRLSRRKRKRKTWTLTSLVERSSRKYQHRFSQRPCNAHRHNPWKMKMICDAFTLVTELVSWPV